MKWSEFKAAVLTLITVDAKRLGLENYITSLTRLGVDELQFYLEYLREGHVKVFHADDVSPDGQASRGLIPRHAFLRQWELVSTADNGGRIPMNYYPFSNVADMQNLRHTRLSPAFYTIDPTNRHFWITPALNEKRNLRLTYDLKSVGTIADEDEVPFDLDVTLVVAEYVKMRISREVDRNLKMVASYQEAYHTGRTKLYLQHKERQAEKTTPSPATSPVDTCLPMPIVVCHPSYPGYPSAGGGMLVPYFPCHCPCATRTPPTDHIVLFGDSGQSWALEKTAAVADKVNAMNPDVIIQLGDASYPVGDTPGGYDTLIPENFLQWYHAQTKEHLLLAFGNHDLEWDYGRRFLDRMPKLAEAIKNQHGDKGYEQGWWWYAVQQQFVTFFILNSGVHDSDSFARFAEQREWLQSSLATSGTPWNVVVCHRPPYCSDVSHAPGSSVMQMPFKEWGADLVLSAHGHSYERLRVDGLDYIVAGTGGADLRDKTADSSDIPTDDNGKLVSLAFHKAHGFLSLTVGEERLQVEFVPLMGDGPLDRLRLVR